LKCKKGLGYQDLKFRSKKDLRQGFGFDKLSLKEEFVFAGKNKLEFYSSEQITGGLEGCRITEENDRVFVIIPRKIKQKIPDKQRFSFVSLDPGVRTFQTLFSEFVIGKIGERDFSRIFRLCKHLDSLISRKNKGEIKLAKPIQRLRWRIKDLVSDLHHKLAYFLVTNFDTIFLPTFETSSMVSKLHNKTARMMMTFSHYKFKQFLKNKAEEYSCTVVDVNEAYTSKTCSFCGKINKIGSKKVLKCNCGTKIDRDLNGARGIYLRAMLASTRT